MTEQQFYLLVIIMTCLAFLAYDNDKAMATCQKTQSQAVCQHSIL